MIGSVIEFNSKILGIPLREVGPLGKGEAEHLVKCLHEEASELEEGFRQGDFIKQIDSCGDAIYFAIGGLYKMGLPESIIQEIFDEAIHRANMTKKKGVVASRAVDGAPDAVKPNGWIPPEERIAAILDRYTRTGA